MQLKQKGIFQQMYCFEKKDSVRLKENYLNMGQTSPSGENIYPEEIEDLLNAQPYIAESLVIEREGKLVALVYPDSEAMKQHKISRDTLLKIIHETRKQINQQIPAYSQIARIEIHDEEFEKTPKRSIKRFLYQ